MRFTHFWQRLHPAGGRDRSTGGHDRPAADRPPRQPPSAAGDHPRQPPSATGDRPRAQTRAAAGDRPRAQTRAAAGDRPLRPPEVADEIESFLAGRLVDHLSALHVDVPAWAALNRLAHADRHELQVLVNGTGEPWGTCPLLDQPRWAPSERTVVRVLLARASTAEALAEVQRTTLVRLELDLIERCRTYRMTGEQVLGCAAEALRTCRPDR